MSGDNPVAPPSGQDAGVPGGINRRRAERVPMPPAGGPVSVVGARLIDISPFGMAIETPMSLPAEAHLDFRLVIAGQKEDVGARVAMCRPTGEGRRTYTAGLEFLNVGPGVRDHLREVLEAHKAATAAG